jgi:futalosine hydrolase
VLILVPTALESDMLFPHGSPGRVALCGFGLAAAGAGAAHAIAANRSAASDGVVLVGAAGTYDPDRHPVGSAVVAGAIRCVGIGIGAGEGPAHRSAAELGFAPSDAIVLGDGVELLSVTAAAGSPAEAAGRRERHPEAAGEEMEGYAVAVAAQLFGAGLTIVRGFSNVAGDRDRSAWRMQDALERAAGLVLEATG